MNKCFFLFVVVVVVVVVFVVGTICIPLDGVPTEEIDAALGGRNHGSAGGGLWSHIGGAREARARARCCRQQEQSGKDGEHRGRGRRQRRRRGRERMSSSISVWVLQINTPYLERRDDTWPPCHRLPSHCTNLRGARASNTGALATKCVWSCL